MVSYNIIYKNRDDTLNISKKYLIIYRYNVD